MNQNFVAGLGNIYCSEILFRSNIKPIRPINLIKDYEINKIVNSVKKILLNSIKLGGTTIKNFVVSDEKIGYFKNKLMVYGRDGMSCFKCKNKIVKITQSGRSTFFVLNVKNKNINNISSLFFGVTHILFVKVHKWT